MNNKPIFYYVLFSCASVVSKKELELFLTLTRHYFNYCFIILRHPRTFLKNLKKLKILVSIHYCVSFDHFNIRTLLSQCDETGFFKMYRQDFWVKKISTESTLCFYYSQGFCSALNTSNFGVNMKLILLYRGFQTFNMFILGQFWRLYKFSFMTRIFFNHPRTPYIVLF